MWKVSAGETRIYRAHCSSSIICRIATLSHALQAFSIAWATQSRRELEVRVDQLLRHAKESLRNELPKFNYFKSYFLQLRKAQSASSNPANSQSAPGTLNDPGKKDVVDEVEDQQANPNFLLFNESEPYYPNLVIYELCAGFDGDLCQIQPSDMILSDSAYFSNTTGDSKDFLLRRCFLHAGFCTEQLLL